MCPPPVLPHSCGFSPEPSSPQVPVYYNRRTLFGWCRFRLFCRYAESLSSSPQLASIDGKICRTRNRTLLRQFRCSHHLSAAEQWGSSPLVLPVSVPRSPGRSLQKRCSAKRLHLASEWFERPALRLLDSPSGSTRNSSEKTKFSVPHRNSSAS